MTLRSAFNWSLLPPKDQLFAVSNFLRSQSWESGKLTEEVTQTT